MSVENIYDFETQLETAFLAGLTAAGLTAVGPADAPTFERTRPYVAIRFACGPAKQSYHIVSGAKRNASWSGQLEVVLITDATATGKASHRNYRALVRKVMADLRNTLNADLDYHKIQNIVEQSTAPEYKPEDGSEMSHLLYAVDFGIDAGAWGELTT
jgi:hypothetical protein